MKKPKPILWYTDQAKRDLDNIRLFLRRTRGGQPSRRIREITRAADRVRDSPKLYPVEDAHPTSRLGFRRKNVKQFVIIYAYIEPTARRPEGMVNIRAIRHGAKEDVLFRVEEGRAIAGWEFPPLRTGHHTRNACWRGEPIDYGTAADAMLYCTRGATCDATFPRKRREVALPAVR
jgi:plasmid stabilization system protein ParE